ncbi:hypothetical protein FZH23_17375 [Salmonella enterica]|nr:hypothetical protein [Salmonella enterica]
MKTAFAKDIPFIKTHHAQSTPTQAEERILKVCHKHDLIFEGFILPFTGSDAKFKLSHAKTGVSKVYNLKALSSITGNELKRNEIGYRLEITERCESRGKKFLGWEGEYNHLNGTRCKILCVKHDHIMTPILNIALRRELNCPDCEAEIRLAAKNGCSSIDELKEKRFKEIDGLCQEAGYRFVCWLTEQKSLKETRFRCNCPHHGEWEQSTREPCDRGILYCPSCLSERRSLESGEYNIKRLGMTRPVYFYVQQLDDKYIKFGFTVNVEKRMKEQAKRSKFNHKLIYSRLFDRGWLAVDLEKGIKLNIKGKTAKKEDVPDGWTETRQFKHLPKMIKFIEDYISSNPDKPLYLTQWNDNVFPDYDDIDSWFPSFDEAA